MGEPRRSSRRLSARLGDQEDAPSVNGIAHGNEKGKHGQNSGNTAKQAKAGVNGASSAGAKGKRKLDYDEDADGFIFTRQRAKKAKAEPAPQIPPIQEDRQEETPKAAPVRKTTKRTSGSPNAAAVENNEKPQRQRRSARTSGDKDLVAENKSSPPPLEVKRKRKTKEDTSQATRKSKRTDQATSSQQFQEPTTTEPQRTQPVDKPLDPIKVSLPFADTPIIRRNKEMRKGAENGSRRSSLGMRGRRASSLIDSGKSDGKECVTCNSYIGADSVAALPHDEVETSEYYKHIESSLTEPRRMKQLLTWCGRRALGNKPSISQEDFSARQAAREIQQQLLKDFSSKSELSDWFNRKDTTPPPQRPKPNPKNISNENKIKDLEQQLARLQTERQSWETLLRPPSSDLLTLSPLIATPDPTDISSDLLADATQASLLHTLQSTTSQEPPPSTSPSATAPAATNEGLQSTTASRLQHITSTLEFSIDTFATNIHALNAFKNSADRVAGEVLNISAEALEEREREGRRRGGDGEEEEEEVVEAGGSARDGGEEGTWKRTGKGRQGSL
ncbi:MAG: hypothetical protein Q9218_000626 [Villophora microphyllina]